MLVRKRRFVVGEASQVAKRGVTFQTTAREEERVRRVYWLDEGVRLIED